MALLLWAAYFTTAELLAHAVLHDRAQYANPAIKGYFHGFIDKLAVAPPLARWDSIWFYGVAKEGYAGDSPDSRDTAAFLPLYPLAMRWLGDAVGLDYFAAGLWISRLSLLGVLWMFLSYRADEISRDEDSWPAVAALLAFPSSFLLVAAYSDSLFLALALATFALAKRGSPFASLTAFLASLTRVHGLALIPALLVMGIGQWRAGRRSATVFTPAVACVAAYGLLLALSAARFGDPLQHFAVRHEVWRVWSL